MPPVNHLRTSADGLARLKKHEAVIDGLYDDASGYSTYGVGHLSHGDKAPTFLLAAALGGGAAFAPHVEYKVWSKKSKTAYLPRRVLGSDAMPAIHQEAIAKAKAHYARPYKKAFADLGPSEQKLVTARATAAVTGERKLLEHTVDEVLRTDLARFEKGVNGAVTTPLTQGEFDALVSFAFNVGLGNLQASTLLKRVNEAKHRAGPADQRKAAVDAVAGEFAKWNKSGGKVLKGLTRRRQDEADQFLKDAREQLKQPNCPSPAIDPERFKGVVLPSHTPTPTPVPARGQPLLGGPRHLT